MEAQRLAASRARAHIAFGTAMRRTLASMTVSKPVAVTSRRSISISTSARTRLPLESHGASRGIRSFPLYGLQAHLARSLPGLQLDTWSASPPRPPPTPQARKDVVPRKPKSSTGDVEAAPDDTAVSQEQTTLKGKGKQQLQVPSLDADVDTHADTHAPVEHEDPHTRHLRHMRWAMKRGHLLEAMGHFQKHACPPPSLPSDHAASSSSSAAAAPALAPHVFDYLAIEIRHVFLGRKRLRFTQGDTWRPSSLPVTVEVQSVPTQTLCAFALSTLYDACLAAGYQPSQRFLSILIHCLAALLPASEFTAALDLILCAQDPHPLGLHAVSAVITSYGRLGEPQTGERFLEQWAIRARTVAADGAVTAASARLVPDTRLPTTGWSHDVAIWNSLIQSRLRGGDEPGAARWLQRYAAACSDPCMALSRAQRPQRRVSVFLTLAHGILRRCPPGKVHPRRLARIRCVVANLRRDELQGSVEMLNFLADLERRQGDGEASAEVLAAVGRGSSAGPLGRSGGALHLDVSRWDSHTYRQVFRLFCSCSQCEQDSTLSTHPREIHPSLTHPRVLLRHLLASHWAHTASRPRDTSPVLHPTTLFQALHALILARDFPAAVVALQAFVYCGLELDMPSAAQHILQPLWSLGLGIDVDVGGARARARGLQQREREHADLDAALRAWSFRGPGAGPGADPSAPSPPASAAWEDDDGGGGNVHHVRLPDGMTLTVRRRRDVLSFHSVRVDVDVDSDLGTGRVRELARAQCEAMAAGGAAGGVAGGKEAGQSAEQREHLPEREAERERPRSKGKKSRVKLLQKMFLQAIAGGYHVQPEPVPARSARPGPGPRGEPKASRSEAQAGRGEAQLSPPDVHGDGSPRAALSSAIDSARRAVLPLAWCRAIERSRAGVAVGEEAREGTGLKRRSGRAGLGD